MRDVTIKRNGGQIMQVTSIELPVELYRSVKHRAVDEGTSFRAVVQKALEEYLAPVSFVNAEVVSNAEVKKGGRKP